MNPTKETQKELDGFGESNNSETEMLECEKLKRLNNKIIRTIGTKKIRMKMKA